MISTVSLIKYQVSIIYCASAPPPRASVATHHCSPPSSSPALAWRGRRAAVLGSLALPVLPED